MKEPDKIPLNPENNASKKEPQKIRLLPLVQHLYDDFGYVTSIEIENEDNIENNSQSI